MSKKARIAAIKEAAKRKKRSVKATIKNEEVKPLVDPKEFESNKREIKYIVIHCAATPPSMDIGRERIKKWHLDRGFVDIGYHFIIKRDGSIDKGRDMDGDGLVIEETGAHARGVNSVSIGVCWVGGVMEKDKRTAEDNRTPEQLKTMKQLIGELAKQYPEAKIRGHRDFPGVSKSCPSFDVKNWCEVVGIQAN